MAAIAIGIGLFHDSAATKPATANVAPRSTRATPASQPVALAAVRPVKPPVRAADEPRTAIANVEDPTDRGNDVVVVPQSGVTQGKAIWTKELDGVTATLLDNGIIGYSRKYEPGEGADTEAWPPKAAAAVKRLVAEAREYTESHLPTMRRRDYDQMVAAEEDERTFREAERAREIEAQLDKEGVPADKRQATSVWVADKLPD